MAQAQGGNAQIVFGEEITFKSTPVLSLHSCEAAWDELVDADATVTADSSVYKIGSKSFKAVLGAGLGAGDIVATDAITSSDLTYYTHIGLWIRSSVALSAGDFQILLDNTAQCASPIESLDLPAIVTADVDTWQFVKLALVAPASCTAIISIGLKQIVDKGAMTIYLDGIQAMRQGRVFPFISESMGMSRNLITSKAIRISRQAQRPALGKKEMAGNVVMELHTQMQFMFKHLLGDYTMSGAGAPYTHYFKIGSTLPTGITIDKYFSDVPLCFRENGVRINAMSFSSPDEGSVPVTFDVMGAKETTDSTNLSFDSDPVDLGAIPFDAFEASIKEGGSTLGTVTKFDLKIENNLDGSVYIFDGTGERYSIPAGKVRVSGNLEILFEDLTLYTKALNNTETSLEIIFTKGAGTGASAGNEKLTFEMNEVVLAPKSPEVATDAGIKISLPFEAYYDNDADASAIQITLLNATGSY